VNTADAAAQAGYRLPEFAYHAPPELTSGTRRRHPLVIVGAGLAGLTLAADLAQRGVASVVLDDDNTVGVRGASSRGIVYVQRTLEIMDRIGIYERMAGKGVRWSVGKVLAGNDLLYQFDLQPASVSKQPPFMNLQQFYLEWFLVDRIHELGRTELRWKNRLCGIENRPDGVLLQVDTPDGRYAMEADWVVDAEGVNSFARRHLGLAEHTRRGQDRWCITDVRFTQPRANERWTWIEAPFNQDRGVWQHLMADQVWRLDFQMAPDADPAEVSRPEVARERVAAMLGPGVAFDVVWVGPYVYRSMLMERFRHGRLLFIGDAAHAHNPFGARGGNSGIMDADNLGWKLALLLAGRTGEQVLDTFEAERHRAAEENVRITSRTGRFMQPRSAAEFTLRTAVLQLARHHAFARSLLNPGRLCTPHHYGGLRTVGTGPHDGCAVANVEIGRAGQALHLVDLLRDTGERLLALRFGGDAAALQAAAEAAGLPLHVLEVGRDLQDTQGLLAAQTGTPPGGVALLRPDSHLAASLPDAAPGPVLQAARRTLGLPG
jgi:3-(3-hydroxy-phenyl)propionate hydroxylase